MSVKILYWYNLQWIESLKDQNMEQFYILPTDSLIISDCSHFASLFYPPHHHYIKNVFSFTTWVEVADMVPLT